MYKKYEKPVARNLGDMIPSATGNCGSGTSAGTRLPCNVGGLPGYIEHCGVGSYANGACNNGNLANH